MEIAQDIVQQLSADFPASEVAERLEQLVQASLSDRVQRCIVFAARGHPWYFNYLCRRAKSDYRDVIVAAEYDSPGGARLYDFNKPINEAKIDDPYGGIGG